MTTYLMTKSGVSVRVQMQRVITKWSYRSWLPHALPHSVHRVPTHTNARKHHHTQTAPRYGSRLIHALESLTP